ncbi:MAG: serine/threonine protein kinase [Myxococcales bacterium]|nr:serine/threonine protein kinase [Myxococcales bacterium]
MSPIDTPSSSDSAEIVQQRVALFAKVMLGISGLGAGLQLAGDLIDRTPERPLGPLLAFDAVGLLSLVGLYAVCRSRPRSLRLIYGLEAVVVLVNVLIAALGGRYLNLTLYPQFATALEGAPISASVHLLLAATVQHYTSISITLGTTHALVLRAALVPSTVRHSLLLTVVVGCLLFAVNGMGTFPGIADRSLRDALPVQGRVLITGILVVWWVFTTIVCVVITRVIHGLRHEVREARRLGQYELLEKLGEGGMGQVFRARHAMMRRPTAVKLLAAGADEASLGRFEREVQLTARLTHPNTVTIFDYGRTPDGVFYYAMELLEGADLEVIVETSGPMPEGRVLRVLSMVAGALAEAHAVGLIHRDIKPANVLLCERGGEADVAKVVDFGLVKDLESEASPALSQVGAITGTPLFMAPEAIRARESVDGRADLYSLGAVGYFLLTGQHVFEGSSVIDVCAKHLHAEPEPPSARLGKPVEVTLEATLLACLAKDRDARPASATELLERLRQVVVPPWTQDDARAWWQRWGPVIRDRRRGEEAPAVAATVVAVDLGAR